MGGSKAETLQAPAEHLWEMGRGEARPWLQSRPTSTGESRRKTARANGAQMERGTVMGNWEAVLEDLALELGLNH